MYKMNDRSAAIREIQIFLETLEILDSYIAPNGIYDSKTKSAVIKFQEMLGIQATGVVDYLTYTKLYESYILKSKSEKIENNIGQNIKFPFKIGDYGEHIGVFNDMLSFILNKYGIFNSLRKSMYFSVETQAAVNDARKTFSMPEGEADQLFYDRLLRETDFLKRSEKIFKAFE